MDDLPTMLRVRCTAGRSDERELVCRAANEIERLRSTLRDLIDAYLADVNPNDRNQAAIEHARRDLKGQGNDEIEQLRAIARDARDHVPPDVLARIDAALSNNQ